MGTRRRRALARALATSAVTTALVGVAATSLTAATGNNTAAPSARAAATRDILVVSNNWDGTADVVDPRTFRRLTRLNIVPDFRQRVAEIERDPGRRGYFTQIRRLVGEGHNQLVDDAFTSPDGRELYVSRPSLADVVAIDFRTRRIRWRVPVDGYRSDHMAISANGRRLLVSASTARAVDVIDTRRGRIVGRFPSGDAPHENNFSRDGKLIYHASIGHVFSGQDDPSQDALKGDRWFEVVDARTLRVKKRIDMGKKLAAFGLGGVSSAVRPMALSPDERFVYFQLSFLHGFVEYDLKRDRPRRVALLPLTAKSKRLRRQDYLLDSAHHGLTINHRGTKLCAAGTMSDYAAIVSRKSLKARIIPVGPKPYWSTTSRDGRYCFVSVSGADRVSVISFARAREVARIRVGDHPQRMRMGKIRVSALRKARRGR